jgi:hypothetical protein
MPSAPQPGGNSSHHEDRKDLKELQSFFFAVFVVLAVRYLHMIFSQLRRDHRGSWPFYALQQRLVRE